MPYHPRQVVEHLRVEIARRRLEETQHSLKQIAGECGLGTPNQCAVFQRALRITPGSIGNAFKARAARRGGRAAAGAAAAQRH